MNNFVQKLIDKIGRKFGNAQSSLAEDLGMRDQLADKVKQFEKIKETSDDYSSGYHTLVQEAEASDQERYNPLKVLERLDEDEEKRKSA